MLQDEAVKFQKEAVNFQKAAVHFQKEAVTFQKEAVNFQKEVEQLRSKLTGSSEDAAQTLYTSRVQEMQDQIQLMQVSNGAESLSLSLTGWLAGWLTD